LPFTAILKTIGLGRAPHRFRWRASHPLPRRRLARSAGVWALIAMAATALYVGFISRNSQAAVSEALRTFGQCRVTIYDCSGLQHAVRGAGALLGLWWP
jgi:hypothetical protein